MIIRGLDTHYHNLTSRPSFPNLSTFSLPHVLRIIAIALIISTKSDCSAFFIVKCCSVSKSSFAKTTHSRIRPISSIRRDFAPSASAHDDMSGIEMNGVSSNCTKNAVAYERSRYLDTVSNSLSKRINSGKSSNGTLYITVGPQCSGKTTILRNLFGKSSHKAAGPDETDEMSAIGLDVTIDDQEMVYIPVPLQFFLQKPYLNDSDTTSYYSNLLERDVLGQKIRQRINDPSQDELTLVIQRLGGILSGEKFKARILRNNQQNANGNSNINNGCEKICRQKSVEDELVDALEFVSSISSNKNEYDSVNSIARLPKTVDLFIVESIFRERPLHNFCEESNEKSSNFTPSTNIVLAPSALDAAQHILQHHANSTLPQSRSKHPSNAPLAWGNTNTRPREYKIALEVAENSGRPVEFIVFGGIEACEMIRNHVTRREYRKMIHDREESLPNIQTDGIEVSTTETNDYTIASLPKLDLQTLLRRNLQRFLQTGRYIPSRAIADAIIRTESLLASAVAEAKKEYEKSRQAGVCQDENVVTAPINVADAKFRLDLELAKLAGFKLNPDRTVSSYPNNSEGIIDRGKHHRNKSLERERNTGRSGRAIFGRGGANYQRSIGDCRHRGDYRNTDAPGTRSRYQRGQNLHEIEGRAWRNGANRGDGQNGQNNTQKRNRGFQQKQGRSQHPDFKPFHDCREDHKTNFQNRGRGIGGRVWKDTH
ncbi:hypothetical protein ACHAXS_004881 [Conticribra weissflogii]